MLSQSFNTIEKQRAAFLSSIAPLPSGSRARILRALSCAETAHKGQYRDDGAPYVIHPIRVANSLIYDFGYTAPSVIAAALLHDVVEDTSVSLHDIKKEFGAAIARIVADVTDMRPSHETDQKKIQRKRAKLEYLRRRGITSRIVKCADLLDNMRSWPLLTKKHRSWKKLPRWMNEAHSTYLALAQITDKRMYAMFRKNLKGFERTFARTKHA